MPLRQAYQKSLLTRPNANCCFHPWRTNKLKTTVDKMFWWDKYLGAAKKWKNETKEWFRSLWGQNKAWLCLTVSKCMFREIQAMQPYSGGPHLEEQWFERKKKLVMKLQYFIASEIFGSVEMGVCRGTERLKEPFLFSAGMTTLERHTHHWWHAKEKGDKLGRVQKRMKEWSKNRTTDLGNKLKEFCLFSLSKKSLLGSCFVVC